MRDRGEPPSDGVVKGQSDGERPEGFFSKLRRLGHDQEQAIVEVDDGAMRAAGGRLADARANRLGRVDSGGPARLARPATVTIGDNAEVRVQLSPVLLAHRFERRDVFREA